MALQARSTALPDLCGPLLHVDLLVVVPRVGELGAHVVRVAEVHLATQHAGLLLLRVSKSGNVATMKLLLGSWLIAIAPHLANLLDDEVLGDDVEEKVGEGVEEDDRLHLDVPRQVDQLGGQRGGPPLDSVHRHAPAVSWFTTERLQSLLPVFTCTSLHADARNFLEFFKMSSKLFKNSQVFFRSKAASF